MLDVVAEDPQEQHVAGEMEQPAVHEHAREQRQPDRVRPGFLRHDDGLAVDRDGLRVDQVDAVDDLVRNGAEAVRELLTALAGSSSLEQEEDEDVQTDDRQRDVGRPVATLVLVADREHRRKDRAGFAP